MAGHGGGAWKVAYADFVTAMMAFFLVMWITAQDKAVKEAIAQYFHDPLGTSSKASGSSSPLPDKDSPPPNGRGPGAGTRRLAIGASEPPPDADRVEVKTPSLFVLHGGERQNAGTVVFFEEGSAELDDRARRQLDTLLPMLRGKRNKIELRGHASRRPLPPGSPFHDAWQLSFARSRAVIQHLEAQGIEGERVRLSQAAGFEPFSAETDAASQAKNSRVEVYLLGEFVEDYVGTEREWLAPVARDDAPAP